MKKSILLVATLLLYAMTQAGESYTTVGILLDKKGNAVARVFGCLKKVGVKDVSIEINSPKPAIHVLRSQAEKARKALRHSNLKVKIVEQKKHAK
jgi:hypothetical protein